MKKIYYLIVLFVVLCFSIIIVKNYHTKGSSSTNSDNNGNIELADSKEPVYVFNLNEFIKTLKSSRQKYDYLKAAFAIQGLVNRDKPRLYYIYENNGLGDIDNFWKTELFENDGGDLSSAYETDTTTISSFEKIINYAKDLGVINGYVLWDEKVPATSNVASTIAGVENLVPIRYDTSPDSLYSKYANLIGKEKKNLVGKFGKSTYLPDEYLHNITRECKDQYSSDEHGVNFVQRGKKCSVSTGSAKNDAYLWAKEYYLDKKKTNGSLMAYVRDSWTSSSLSSCKTEACFVDSFLPQQMGPNTEIEGYVTIYNNTSATWDKKYNYRIAASQSGSNNFQITNAEYGFEQGDDVKNARIYLNPDKPVGPGEYVTIKFTIKAPSTTEQHTLSLGVVRDGVGWLSGELNVTIGILPSVSGINTIKEYVGQYDKVTGGLFNAGLNNSDYFIQNKAFFFDLSPDEKIAPIDDRNQKVGTDVSTMEKLLKQQYNNNGYEVFSVSGFVPWYLKYSNKSDSKSGITEFKTEWNFVDIISKYGGEKEADAYSPAGMTNASIFTHVKLYSELKQNNDKEAIKSGQTVKESYDPNTIYFMVYMGDYDGATWTSGVLPYKFVDSEYSNDKYPLAWAIDSDLSKRIPHVYNWLYKRMRPNDYFVAGNNGTGYLNPLLYSETYKWTSHNVKMNKKFDIDVTGCLLSPERSITNSIQKSYAEMSPVLVGYQSAGGVENEKIDNTPFIPIYNTSPDGTANGSNVAKEMKAVLASVKQQFIGFRTIQLSRSQAYKAIEEVEKEEINGKKVKVVDPYTMAKLYSQTQEGVQGATFVRNACVSNGKTRQWIESGSIPSGYSLVSGVKSKEECGSMTEEPLSGSGISDPTENIIGDVNGDTKVNSLDYIQIRKHVIGTKKLTGDSYNRADMNGDTKVNSLDYIILRKQIINGNKNT